MKKRSLYALWGAMAIVCAGVGFIPSPAGVGKWALTALGVLFFVPPGLLMALARKEKDRHCLALLRNLSAWSLGLTLVLLVANVAAALAPRLVGDVLGAVLGIVSVPMYCTQIWVLSLFLWACLLFASIGFLKR